MKIYYKKRLEILVLIVLTLIFSIKLILAAASFQVTSFSCSPSESVINNAFSCTAQVGNIGDANGSVSVATLYPDANNWLESSNYPQSSGVVLTPGQSTSITFSGLRAIKSGNNGFSKIMLDLVTDTYVADNNKKVNVINVAVSISNSASSAARGGSVTAASEVTAGGNIDVSLTFSASSGGCSIGSQTNPKSITGMTDGSKQSRTWTITQGTSGDCQYTISAAATGAGGVASKIDSSSSTITCTNCPSGGSSTSSSSSGGAGGAGGEGSKTYQIGELSSAQLVEAGSGERIKFNISGDEHTITLINVTETTAKITIESKKQTFTLNLGEEIKVDLNEDNNADISVKLKSVNIITKKASIILERISGGVPSKPIEETGEGGVQGGEEKEELGSIISNKFLWIIIIIFVVIAIASIAYYIFQKRKRW